MSYYVIKYEFMGQDSAGLRGGEVQFEVSKFFEPIGMSLRKSQSARRPWKNLQRHTNRLEGLTDLILVPHGSPGPGHCVP